MMTKPHSFLDPICESSVSCHVEGSAGHRLEWSPLVKSRGVVGLAIVAKEGGGCQASGVSNIQPNVRTKSLRFFKRLGTLFVISLVYLGNTHLPQLFEGQTQMGFEKGD